MYKTNITKELEQKCIDLENQVLEIEELEKSTIEDIDSYLEKLGSDSYKYKSKEELIVIIINQEEVIKNWTKKYAELESENDSLKILQSRMTEVKFEYKKLYDAYEKIYNKIRGDE